MPDICESLMECCSFKVLDGRDRPGKGVESQFLKEISGPLHLLPAKHSRKGFEMGPEPRDPTGSHDCVNPLGRRLREMSKA